MSVEAAMCGAAKLTVLTPTFAPDFERCRFLCETADAYLDDDFAHYLIVDRRDIALFKSLEGPRRSLVAVEDLAPGWLFRAPFLSGAWVSLRTAPVRNWIVQQVVKIAATTKLPGDDFLIVDSDCFFARPLNADEFYNDGALRLFRTEQSGSRDAQDNWYREAARLLGLDEQKVAQTRAGFIGNLITWRKDRVKAMCTAIEIAGGRPWAQALCASRGFSEYILYGLFAENGPYSFDNPALGALVPDSSALTLEYWPDTPMNKEELAEFAASLAPTHASVMISAKAGMVPSDYAAIFKPASDVEEPSDDPSAPSTTDKKSGEFVYK